MSSIFTTAVLTKAQMKQAEVLADLDGVSFAELMENAGSAAFNCLQEKLDLKRKTCAVLVGKGNNGGDGFVLARLIEEAGGTVSIILCDGDPESALSCENYSRLASRIAPIINGADDPDAAQLLLSSVEVIVDAVYGTGFSGELPRSVSEIFKGANSARGVQISLDLPSGINADTGEVAENSFQAAITLCFAAQKLIHTLEASSPYCGEIILLDIGITDDQIIKARSYQEPITSETVKQKLPIRRKDAHKGDFGALLNVSGSLTMGGAAMMSTLAALRSGSGVVRLATTSAVAAMIMPHLMECMVTPVPESRSGSMSASALPFLKKLVAKSNCCLVGCGLSVTPDTKQVVEYLVENINGGMVIDADGLNILTEQPKLLDKRAGGTVITPHVGEMAALCDKTIAEILLAPADYARELAVNHNVIVVLKSSETIIASPIGNLYRFSGGNSGLAKGGSGDVLAGIIAGLMTQGLAPLDAALCGVCLHGLCAESVGERYSLHGMLARDVIEELPVIMKRLGV